jgi:tetratricopeptide (TPR) repeat protein
MSRLTLAVPVVSFLVFLSLSSVLAQSNPPSPPAQTVAVKTDDTPKLSDEDLARLYLVRKQYHEAQEIFHKLTLEHPSNAVYWNELGISLHNQMDLNNALKCYEKASKLDKKYSDPLNNIGTIYYERKKYPKAIRAYKRAIAIRDDFAPFYLNLGYAYFAEKQYDDSIVSFRKALQIDPDAFEASKSRSGTVIQDRSLGSDRARFYFLLAKSFAEAGNVERCAIYLKKARDEGYKDIGDASSDPSFAKIINDPAIQEVLVNKPPETTQQ